MRLGFIGLGAMGEPMSRNLLKAGHSLTVYNRSRPALERASQAGAAVAESPRDVALASEIVLTCLATPTAVEAVYLGPEGLRQGAGEGQLFVDLSSIAPGLARKLAEQLAAAGASVLDSPVSGGTKGAEAGTLTIMVGGEAGQVRQVEPVLRTLGSKIIHAGPVGAGSALKILNQLLVGINTLATLEVALLTQRWGMDPELVEEVITASTGYSRSFESRFQKALHREFSLGFAIDLMSKDLRLGLEMAGEKGTSLPLASAALAQYEQASKIGFGRQDTSAAIEVLEGKANGREEGSGEATSKG